MDETVRRTIKGLIEGSRQLVDDVAPAVGMTRSTLYARLRGYGSRQCFSAGEVAVLANHLGVPVERIFSGFDGTFAPPTNPDGSLWAPRGSNPQPADQTSAQVSEVSNLILGGFPWHEDAAEDYADAPDAEVIHLGTIAGPERSAR